ncbi:MAG: PLP-dependent aminotransferase family protein [Deltaproteobacteria bacterium]|nr:PLP-dependent aminotransferase family protein [Deltaproteobacteria bacterium]
MMLIPIDTSSSIPLYRQVRDRIVELVEKGALRPGDRLPPTREHAATLGLHRTTLVRAYDELRALGYLESRPGSYSTVRRRARPPSVRLAPGNSGRDAKVSAFRWKALVTPGARIALADVAREEEDHAAAGGVIDFSRLSADPRLAPCEELGRYLKRALVRGKGEMLGYADSAGEGPLREAISRRMRTHGVDVSPDEVVVTAGAQSALDRCLRLLAKPGDRVVAEAPTYGLAHRLFRVHGVKVVEVPMLGDGMDLDALARALGHGPAPRFVYTMPNFHNPTGVTTSQAHRERLLAICEEKGVPIVEDGFEEEMKYFGEAVLPIKSMDARGTVLYVGTFSKVAFPGLRLGWIAAPREVVAHLSALERVTSLGGNTLIQAAVARFCASGALESYLRRVPRVFRKRMQATLRALDASIPASVAWPRPAGGYLVWMRLSGPPDSEPETCARLLGAGVRVAPGRPFFGAPPSAPYARLSIACLDEEAIAEGCRRIGRVLRETSPRGISPRT